nr:reverse transcriptase domain-containing protein [Tanacetum cinerariifolium]
MHNNIMAAGSRDRPPMLAIGRYPQWRSRFLRYIDTRPNGDALRKCILNGPYIPTIVVVQVVAAIDDSPAIPKHTTPRKCGKLLKGYNKVNPSAFKMFVMIVKQQHKLDEVSYHKHFDILKQYHKEVNELCVERLARNVNPLALVATAQANQDPYKGKEIAKPITSPSESASKEDSDLEQAQRDKDIQKNLALIAKYFKRIYKPTNNNLRTSSNSRNKNVDTTPRENAGSPVVQQSGIQCFNCKKLGHFAKECKKPKKVKDSTYHKEKMLLCKQAKKGVPLQAEQYDWLADTDEEIDEQELEAHYSYMAKILEVPTADSGTDSEPLEQKVYRNQSLHRLYLKQQGKLTLNVNVVCATCGKCLVDSNHFACVTKMLNDVNARTKKPNVVPISTRQPKGHANKSIATPHKKKVTSKPTNQKPESYFRMLYEKTSLNHNLFSIGQFCDADLEVAFQKSTCFVRDLQGNDLLIGSHPKDTKPTMNIQPTSASSTPTYVHAEENNDNQAEEEHLPDDEFTNPFCAPAQEVAESSSHNIDVDHAGCIDSRKSTFGGIQFLGDKLVSWISKKQNCTAMSSVEAEYVVLSASCAQVMWMRTQLQDYGFDYNKKLWYCDSQPAIAISFNPVQHSCTKHIRTRTEYQLADMFTKPLPEDRFKYLVRRIETNEDEKEPLTESGAEPKLPWVVIPMRLQCNPSSNPTPSTNPNPKVRSRRRSKQRIENFNFEEVYPPIVTMADQRTMAQLHQVPIEGYEDTIVVPAITADNFKLKHEAIVVSSILAEQFELKHSLINMMTSDQFCGLEKDNPHDHIRWFNKITPTIKYKDVPNSAIKLMLFPFSLAGAARRWLEKESPRSIHTWEDRVSKFINELFPPSGTINLRNEIFNFQQRFDESFHEAWDRYKDLLRACPHHGFTELHQLDTFYNALNPADQDSLNAAVGGNLLERRTQDVLTIIENKSKIAKLTHAVNQQTSDVTTAMTAILKQFQATPPPASIKAVEEICVTCGGAHPYYQCLAAGGNTFLELWDNIQGYVSAAVVNYNQGPGHHGIWWANKILNQTPFWLCNLGHGDLRWVHSASLEDFNGFLARYTLFDDLISTVFKQKGVIPEIVFHILKEFAFLLG